MNVTELDMIELPDGTLVSFTDLSARAANADLEMRVAMSHSDIADITFRLAMSELISIDGLKTVHVDVIDSASAVHIISGTYADGKVYI